MALGHDGDMGIAQNIAHGLDRIVPHVRSSSAVERQVLCQDLVNGIEMVIAERPAERHDARMPLVTRIG